jgi:hypothetical protein
VYTPEKNNRLGPGTLEGNLAANFQPEAEAVIGWKLDSLAGISTHIMGRKTYVEMAAFWPTVTGRPLFHDLPEPLSLSLVSSESFADDAVINVHRPTRN